MKKNMKNTKIHKIKSKIPCGVYVILKQSSYVDEHNIERNGLVSKTIFAWNEKHARKKATKNSYFLYGKQLMKFKNGCTALIETNNE